MQPQQYSPTPRYTYFRTTTTLESLPPSVWHLRDVFKHVGKRTKERMFHGAVVVCTNIEELDSDGEADKECWRSVVPHFNFQVPSSAS